MRKLGYRTVDAVVDWLTNDAAPPLCRCPPQEARARVARTPSDSGRNFDDVLGHLMSDVLPYGSRTGHPRFLAFIPGAGTWPGALGDFLASACNVYAGSWMEGAGVTQLELEVLRWFCDWIGYPPEAGGTLLTGSSASNIAALACARETVIGAMRDDLVLYVSDQAHSSIARAARILGFRPAQLRVLPVDRDFRLEPATLAEALDVDLAAGRTPLVAVATAGTTNTGAVDPLEGLAEVCHARHVWLHVDAAYGGFAVLSDRGRKQLAGLGASDSVALDPHKWLYQPYECGCLLVRNGHSLRQAFEIVPDYLQEAHGADDEVNFADYGLQLTRTSRALKIWLSLQTFGLDAFRAAIERSLDLAAHASARIERDERFELCAPPSLGVICFRRRFGVDERDEDSLNAGLVAMLEQSGLGLVSSTRLHGRYSIRMCILNHTTSRTDVDRVLDFLATAEPTASNATATYERHPTVSDRPAPPVQGSSSLFASLDEDELLRATSSAIERVIPAGETVVARWDQSRDFYVLVDGSVEVRIGDNTLCTLEPGEFFGELGAFDWGAGFSYPRLADVEAVTNVRVLVYPDGSLDELIQQFPDIGRKIRAAAAARVARH